jgi:uracil-DNA glycosylase family 4
MANQGTSTHRDDGLKLEGVFVSAAVRCAPPGNKPLPGEIANCSEYLDREWDLLSDARVILALGKIGWDAAVTLAKRHGCEFPDGKVAFGHGAEMRLNDKRRLIGSYHVSQQNTFTGKLTPGMFDAVLRRAQKQIEPPRR